MEFKKFSSIPRLSKDMIITEKIDGTNACVVIENGEIKAQSRNRFIKIGDDNHGFAGWVEENKEDLLKLGDGYHYGEWYGGSIQIGYGIKEKRFALFFLRGLEKPDCCELVPVLYEGKFSTEKVDEVMNELKENGSQAVKGFMNPEGVVVFHTASQQVFKKTFNFDEGKWSENINTNE